LIHAGNSFEWGPGRDPATDAGESTSVDPDCIVLSMAKGLNRGDDGQAAPFSTRKTSKKFGVIRHPLDAGFVGRVEEGFADGFCLEAIFMQSYGRSLEERLLPVSPHRDSACRSPPNFCPSQENAIPTDGTTPVRAKLCRENIQRTQAVIGTVFSGHPTYDSKNDHV